MAVGDVVHAFGENGEMSRGAQNALSAYATLSYVDARVFPVGMGDPIPTSGDLPPEGDGPGDARLAMDTMHLWVWDSQSSTWLDMGTVRGEALTLTTGTVTTLPPGENATFTLVGPEPDYTVNVGLPEGQPAEQPNLSATATTLAPGAGATATVTGTYPNLTLTLGIPEGVQGEGLHILGDKATTGDLPSSGNTQGDAWMVGGPGGDLYVWDGGAWVNLGPLGAASWDDIEDKPTEFPPSAHQHDASDIASGTLASARIPNLPASKITSGTLAIARIPTGTTSSTVALGNHTHTPASIGAATSAQGDLADSAVQPSDIADMVESTTVSTIWTGTTAQYDAIGTKDPNTLYIQTDA